MIKVFPSSTIPGLLSFSLFFFMRFHATAQHFEFSKEIQFVQYLQDKELYDEAKFVLSKIDTTSLSRYQRDTISYLSGWGAYINKQLDTAIIYLLKVSPSFPLYNKSRFFAGYCLAYQKKPDLSKQVVSVLSLTDSMSSEMQSFQLAGMALLERDYESYKKLKPLFTYSLYSVQKEEQNLEMYYKKLSSYKKKSPFLAGIYSALLPGAGKFYAGKKRQGIAAFLPVISLGLITYEAYRRGGINSLRFISFGSLFSVFYIGNIWGSVLSVKIKQKEFNREYDNKILFDLHIPLRNFYH